MIGGGGGKIVNGQITGSQGEAQKASFLEKGQGEHDFGNDGDYDATNNKAYYLNLWIN